VREEIMVGDGVVVVVVVKHRVISHAIYSHPLLFLLLFRDPRMMVTRLVAPSVMGIILGLAYIPTAGVSQQDRITDVLGLFFVASSFVVIMSVFGVAAFLSKELPLFLREHAAGE